MINRQELYKSFAKKVDKKVMRGRHGGVVTVTLNWFERRKLSRVWGRSKVQLREAVNYYLRHSYINTVEAEKTMDGRRLSYVAFSARHHVDL